MKQNISLRTEKQKKCPVTGLHASWHLKLPLTAHILENTSEKFVRILT